MNKRLWDLYAPIYERAMRSDERIYEYMYRRILQMVRGMEVLEICSRARPSGETYRACSEVGDGDRLF